MSLAAPMLFHAVGMHYLFVFAEACFFSHWIPAFTACHGGLEVILA